jgi:hypothetical protein
MATFVLVRGGGHGGWCDQKVARPHGPEPDFVAGALVEIAALG